MEVVQSSALGVSVDLPPTWTAGEPADHGRTASWQVAGATPGEGFAVVRLTGADGGSDLAAWLDLPMTVAGGMDPELLVGVPVAEVVTWTEEDDVPWAERLGADAAVVRSGLLSVDGALLRSYVVLARVGAVAWKTALTLAGALGPDADEATVDEHDHARARTCLESLALVP